VHLKENFCERFPQSLVVKTPCFGDVVEFFIFVEPAICESLCRLVS